MGSNIRGKVKATAGVGGPIVTLGAIRKEMDRCCGKKTLKGRLFPLRVRDMLGDLMCLGWCHLVLSLNFPFSWMILDLQILRLRVYMRSLGRTTMVEKQEKGTIPRF